MNDAEIEAVKAEVAAAYDRYLGAFIRNDRAGIDAVIQYPLTHMGEGAVRSFDAFPFDPDALRRSKGWHTTVNAELEVVAASATKAHVVLRSADRIREDGSLIERVSAFYAFTKTPDGWKIFAVSDVIHPA